MGRHGTPDSELEPGAAASGAPRAWDAGAWDAAIAFDPSDSLYASDAHETLPPPHSHDTYQPVNDWSGVYQVQQPQQQPQSYDSGYYAASPAAGHGFYDYEAPAYEAPVQQHDQTYYESVYAAYSEPVAPTTPTWEGPSWQDPYAATDFYAQPEPYQAPQAAYEAPSSYPLDDQYSPRNYGQHGQVPFEPVSFHDPTFDTGQFEAIYASDDATDAEYDQLPEGDDADGYAADYEYDLDYDQDYEEADAEHVASDADYDYDEPDVAPLRSRSRSGPSGPGTGTKAPRTGRSPMGRRTLTTLAAAPAAVVGVAAVAVAAVGGMRLPTHTESAASEPTTPASGLEQNLLQMRAASANLADRATRSEQRTELSQQQSLQKQRLQEMAPKFFLPVDIYSLTAGFGDSGSRWSNLHTGQDFAVPIGTRVVSVTDGVVTDAGWAGPYGYRVIVTHPDGSQTWYCHLSVIKVKSGPVKAGQLIAYSGNTGNSTGAHMHFEYHPPGTPDPFIGVPGATTAVDPMPFLRAHGLLP